MRFGLPVLNQWWLSISLPAYRPLCAHVIPNFSFPADSTISVETATCSDLYVEPRVKQALLPLRDTHVLSVRHRHSL
jgi:hypothetical protein